MLNPIYEAALDLQHFCEEQQWKFCFIGGIAAQRWGEPRFTHDADLTLLTGFGEEKRFIVPLLEKFPARRSDAAEFAEHNRVLLLCHPSGVPLDIAMGALSFEAASIERSSLWQAAENCALRTCSAEDLVVHKAFASRPQDWLDAAGIIMRQGPKLDVGQIFRELTPLAELKEDSAIVDRLRALFKKHGELGVSGD